MTAPTELPPLQRRIFEIMRASDESGPIDVASFAIGLAEPGRTAVATADVAALASLGVHPCLLIGFAYAVGAQRPEFIDRLPPFKLSLETPRWRK